MANKFTVALTSGAQAIRAERAKLIGEDAEAAQSELVAKLKQELRDLRRREQSLSDIAPDSELSTLAVKTDFNAKQWAADLQNVKVALLNKSVEIKAAEETYDEWFKAED